VPWRRENFLAPPLMINARAIVDVQTAQKEHVRLMKLREEYQTTCTQSLFFDPHSKEQKKLNSQIDLAFSVEFNLANQVLSSQRYYLSPCLQAYLWAYKKMVV